MKIALTTGAYQARSVIANAQRCINLYAEKNPEDAPVPFTYYPRPGLTVLGTPPVQGANRGTYRSTAGVLYQVVGSNVYLVSSTWAYTLLGTIGTTTGMVSFSDNSLAVVLVDGSTTGYAINMATNAFGTITDPNFLGANKVDYIDTFFVFNKPNTFSWYAGLSTVSYGMLASPVGAVLTGSITGPGTGYTGGGYSVNFIGGTGTGATGFITVSSAGSVIAVTIVNAGTGYVIGDVLTATFGITPGSGFTYTVGTIGGASFSALDIASKVGSADPIVSLIVNHQEIWLLGSLTSEIWYNAGASPFPFQQMPQGFIEHGLEAIFSLTKQDTACYWLSRDREGRGIVMKGAAYIAKRISTHAIEQLWSSYSTLTDAVSYMYQQQGHTYYVVNFPTANATWAFDEATEQWAQWAWTDNNGNLNRHRVNSAANVYSTNVGADWQTGVLYKFDVDKYTDNEQPISRIRSFPHMIDDMNRVFYNTFIADMDVGEITDPNAADPKVYLRWSDDRGVSYGNAIDNTLGKTGQYGVNMQYQRLGLARDRVFELSWSIPAKTALNGAYIRVQKAGS